MLALQDKTINSKLYPFSANLVAIRAPRPDAPPVTIADLFLRSDKFRVFDRSAIGPMIYEIACMLMNIKVWMRGERNGEKGLLALPTLSTLPT